MKQQTTPTPLPHFSEIFSNYNEALESLEKSEKMITENGFIVNQSGIHHLPNNQYMAWQIYTHSCKE